jgi:hypothetical protein
VLRIALSKHFTPLVVVLDYYCLSETLTVRQKCVLCHSRTNLREVTLSTRQPPFEWRCLCFENSRINQSSDGHTCISSYIYINLCIHTSHIPLPPPHTGRYIHIHITCYTLYGRPCDRHLRTSCRHDTTPHLPTLYKMTAIVNRHHCLVDTTTTTYIIKHRHDSWTYILATYLLASSM